MAYMACWSKTGAGTQGLFCYVPSSNGYKKKGAYIHRSGAKRCRDLELVVGVCFAMIYLIRMYFDQISVVGKKNEMK
jgi:hypothetical protein